MQGPGNSEMDRLWSVGLSSIGSWGSDSKTSEGGSQDMAERPQVDHGRPGWGWVGHHQQAFLLG